MQRLFDVLLIISSLLDIDWVQPQVISNILKVKYKIKRYLGFNYSLDIMFSLRYADSP